MPSASQRPPPRCAPPFSFDLEAKPGKEEAVAKFLEGGLPDCGAEPPATVSCVPRSSSVPQTWDLDTFPDNTGRQAHLAGRVAAALIARAPDCSRLRQSSKK